MVRNKGLIFKSVPSGWPVPGENLAIEAREFDLDASAPKDGIMTKNCYVSLDPYQRGRMRAPDVKSYAPAFALGQPLHNRGVAKVLKSGNKSFTAGDIIVGQLPIEEYSSLSGEITNNQIRKLENPLGLDPKLYVGALGMPGLTAYSSFYAIGQPKRGETIFISAASGAVGQVVGQLAKHEGLTVIGSVGSDDKLSFIKEKLNFDGGFNYKKEKPSEALARLAPKGIDIYYENVGGEQLDAAIAAMTNYGRIIACGMISQYNIAAAEDRYCVRNLAMVVGKRLKIQGFIVSDSEMGPKYAAEHQKNIAQWIYDGTFKAQQSITTGIDNAIEGFLGMLKGDNFGKAVLTIAELE